MADDTGNIADTSRRFEIFVPSPKARINLGAPNKDSTGPFGYTGVSIQSDVHLFIDCNKHTLFQSGMNYCGQVGGKWLQYSNSDMVLSATANVNLSAKNKIVIAAGSGQGQVTALDHGSTPVSVPYNNLNLHYRVDRLETGLFEFFYGRRERDAITSPILLTILAVGGLDGEKKYFNAKKKAAQEIQKEALLKGGFSSRTAISLRELYPVDKERGAWEFDKEPKEDGDPVLLLDPLVNHGIFGDSFNPKKLEYGHSAYLKRFDPYHKLKKSDAKGFLGKGLVGFLNVLTKMRRVLDVLERYADLISDNFLAKRAQAAFAAYANLVTAFAQAYGVFKLPFGSFQDPSVLPAFQDEASSGVGARFGGADPAEEGREARERIEARKASIQTTRGPWDLRSSAGTITVCWGDKASHTSCIIDLGAALPAELEVKTSDDKYPALAVNIKVATSTIPAVTDWATMKPLLAAVLGLTEAELDGAEDPNLGASTTLDGAWVRAVRCGNFAAIVLWTDATTTPSTEVRVSDIGVSFAWTETAGTIGVIIDGVVRVSIPVSTTGLGPTNALDSIVHAAFSVLGGTARGGLADSAWTLSTTSLGTDASIQIDVGDTWIYEATGLVFGKVVRGQGPLDLESVTATQLASRIKASAGLSLSTAGGTLTLKAPHDPSLDPRSYVEVSGGGTHDIFGADPTADEVSPYESSDFVGGVAEFEKGLSELRSWNHELSKLPEDARNLARPLRDALAKTISAMGALENAAEKAVEVVGSPLLGLPSAPESIGLIADSGITLATPDRIVGQGGKGVIFICDGGTGKEDHAKFVPTESFVNLALKWDPLDAALEKLMKKNKGEEPEVDDSLDSLGFRVLSDDTIDLLGTTAAQLLALGRAELKAVLPGDDKKQAGIGVARVGASYAVDISGYRKVVISARHRGDDDKTGGRVELAGQTIAIGAMNLQGDTEDFLDEKGFGVEPLEVKDFAGAEHLEDKQKKRLGKELAKYAWTETLRKGGDKGHPNTTRVFVHAEKETVIQVGTYLIHVDADKGVSIGTRKVDKDGTKNELDDTKPMLTMDDQKIELVTKKDGATLTLKGDKTTIKKGANDFVVGNDGITSKNKKFVMTGDEISIKGKRTTKIIGTNMTLKVSGTLKIG